MKLVTERFGKHSGTAGKDLDERRSEIEVKANLDPSPGADIHHMGRNTTPRRIGYDLVRVLSDPAFRHRQFGLGIMR
ncbi:MAG: hypothetical protein OXI81_16805 [Paracoccaceae bacterium]|nr:hypothetical protein [Paracoccaceae bacterium]